MRLELTRFVYSSRSTIGLLTVDGAYECFILEDTTREVNGAPVEQWKVKGHTAIPVGTYRVVVSISNRFGRETPELLEVPGFLGIRVHPGNSAADTEGCLLPGRVRDHDWVGESRKAYDALFAKIAEAARRGDEITITVS